MTAVVARTVEVVLFRFRRDLPEVLLLRRAGGESVYPGMWQIVTGTMHDGERAIETAKREVREETGLVPRALWVVPGVDSFYEPVHDEVHCIPVFAIQVDAEGEVVLSGEHDRFAWVDPAEAIRRLPWPGQRRSVETVREEILRGREAAGLTGYPL
jgi:dATP pyrophosphohydrolase